MTYLDTNSKVNVNTTHCCGEAASLTVTNQSRATTPSSEDTAGPSSLQPEVRRSRSRSELSLAPIGELQLGQPTAVTAGRGPLSPAGPAAGVRGQLSRENSSLGTVGGRQSGAATPATEVGT